MANVKISAAADAGTLLSSDMLPLARSGDTNAYHATMAEISTFTTASVASGAYGNVGRNLLHNSLFNVAQRGAGPWTTNGAYTADRWQLFINLDTASVATGAFNDAQRAQIGDEAAVQALIPTITGNAGAAAYSFVCQLIEKVSRLSNKTVTISFWAYATAGTPKIGVGLRQIFGTGGSPSAPVDVNAIAVTLSTTAARYSVTLTLPSDAGKTLGTNGDDSTRLGLFLSAGANTNTIAGGIGVQSATFVLWGMQLEVGTVATPLEKPDPQQDLAKCQRFYFSGQYGVIGYVSAGSYGGGFSYFPVTMRAAPTITVGAVIGGDTNVSAANAPDTISPSSFRFSFTATAAGEVIAARYFTASADL